MKCLLLGLWQSANHRLFRPSSMIGYDWVEDVEEPQNVKLQWSLSGACELMRDFAMAAFGSFSSKQQETCSFLWNYVLPQVPYSEYNEWYYPLWSTMINHYYHFIFYFIISLLQFLMLLHVTTISMYFVLFLSLFHRSFLCQQWITCTSKCPPGTTLLDHSRTPSSRSVG